MAITPACGFVDTGGALCVGFGGSVFAYIAVAVIKDKCGYDDSLDVFGVHGIAGIWGAVAAGIWAVKEIGGTAGLLEQRPEQVFIQLKSILATVVWSGIVSLILFKIVDFFIGIKAGNHEERVGLDLTEHAEAAYTVVD